MSGITVYWSIVENTHLNGALSLTAIPPYSLYDGYIKKLDIYNKNELKNCPAVIQEASRTLVIESPIDYDIIKTGNVISTKSLNQSFFDNFVTCVDNENGLLFFGYYFVFFCEKDVEITQLHPYFHRTDFTNNTRGIPGSMNISKWITPIHPAFFIDDNKHTKIRRGDPLMYIRVNTDEKINLKRFAYTRDLDDLQQGILKVRSILPHKKLTTLYDLFTSSGISSRIMKIIKHNLIN